MAWLSVACAFLCALAFYFAAETARGLRVGHWRSLLSLVGAVAGFVLIIPALVFFAPPVGLARFLVIATTVITGLACFWFVKGHVDHRYPVAAAVSALLGLTMFGVAFVLQFGDLRATHGLAAGAPEVAAPAEDPTRLWEIRLTERSRQLERRLQSDVHRYRAELKEQAGQVRRSLPSASGSNREQLTDELTEIARLLVALEREETSLEQLLQRLAGLQRGLERLELARDVLSENTRLSGSLNSFWDESDQALTDSLHARVGRGAVAQSEIDSKLNELLTD